jgi:hypothetical protein
MPGDGRGGAIPAANVAWTSLPKQSGRKFPQLQTARFTIQPIARFTV